MSRSSLRMILPVRVFGHVLGPDDPFWPGEPADALGHVLAERILQRRLTGRTHDAAPLG
jgi:hypothetical protein